MVEVECLLKTKLFEDFIFTHLTFGTGFQVFP
ncbi:unnamed protein product, partial [Allacma fusca]